MSFYLFMWAFSLCIIYLILRDMYVPYKIFDTECLISAFILGFAWPITLIPVIIFYYIDVH